MPIWVDEFGVEHEFGVVLSVDKQGHVHRGKGEGGGQFTGDNKGKKKTSRTGTDAPSFKAWFGNSKVVDANGEPKETHGTPVKVHHGTTSVFDAFDKKMAKAANAGTGFYFAEKRELALAFTGEGVFTDEEWEELDFDEDEPRGRIIEAYLSIQNPFVFEDRLPIARATEILEHAEVPIPDSWSDADTVTGWDVWQTIRETVSTKSPPIEFVGDDGRKQMSREFVGTDGVNEILQELGYDGLSHISSDWHGSVAKPASSVRGGPGGSSEGGRCWIAFEPTQIKKTTNTSYDPNNPDMNLGLSVDEHGRVHRGKGEKGGQFASKDGPHLDSYSRVVASSSGDIHVVAAQHQTGGLFRKKGKSWEILFGTSSTAEGSGGSVKATGQAGSDAVRVMREVGRTIEDFVKEKSPESFHFSASRFEKSRVRLYDRLAKRLAEKHGYTLKRKGGLAEITYTFTTSEPALSVDTPETASARALWANKVQRECLLEAGDDVEAGLAAAAQILALIPVDVALSVDVQGYVHKGKGEGGGQFTSKSGSDNEDTGLPAPTKDNTPPSSTVAPPSARPDLTSDELVAAIEYTTAKYRRLNAELRSGQVPKGGVFSGTIETAEDMEAAEEIEAGNIHVGLLSALGKVKTFSKPVKVVRGLRLTPQAQSELVSQVERAAEAGGTVEMRGWISTRKDSKVDPYWKSNCVLHIDAVHGLDVEGISRAPSEKELILPHESHFEVVNLETRKSFFGIGKPVLHIFLRQIPPPPPILPDQGAGLSLSVTNRNSKTSSAEIPQEDRSDKFVDNDIDHWIWHIPGEEDSGDTTLSVDATGHQHRGKGEKGGQFTKATNGNGANTKPEPHYPNKLPERFREQYRQQFEDPDHAKLMPALFAIGVPQGPNPRLAAVHGATIPRDLTQGEKVAQQLYSFGADGPMNGALRQDAPVPDQWKLTHEHLQSAFARAGVLDKPVPVVRGMDLPPDHLKAFLHMAVGARQSGKAIQIKGYTSTATGRHLAPGFKGNVEVQIAAVHGLDMMATTHFPQEQEFLLNHDSQFKVIGVERTSTGYRVQLAQLPPSAHEASPDTQTAHRDGELPSVPKQGLISRIKSLFFSQGDDGKQDGTSSTDQDGIRWDRFTDTSFDHWDLVETNDDTALSIDEEADDWQLSLIALSTALEEWSPYLGVRGANKGKQVGWKHVSGRIVYGLDRPGGRGKAQAAPAPTAKPPKAAKPAKVAPPDKQQVLALVQAAMKQRTPDGVRAALNGLMGLKLPEMRAVLAAAGVKGKGRAKSDLAKLVENQVNSQPVAAPASATKPAPVPAPKPSSAPPPQQPPTPKLKPLDPAFEARKKVVEQATAKATGKASQPDQTPQQSPKAKLKSFLGDWENDPEHASKVIGPDGKPQKTHQITAMPDHTGKPIVVYHGTSQDFDTFDKSKANPNGHFGPGFYFTTNLEEARKFSQSGKGGGKAPAIKEAYLNIRKPFLDDGIKLDQIPERFRKVLADKFPGNNNLGYDELTKTFGGHGAYKVLQAMGYDGMVDTYRSGGHNWWIAFEPEQIMLTKSLTDNSSEAKKIENGVGAAFANFDPNQPRRPVGDPEGGEWVTVGGYIHPATRVHMGGLHAKVTSDGMVTAGPLKGHSIRDVKKHFESLPSDKHRDDFRDALYNNATVPPTLVSDPEQSKIVDPEQSGVRTADPFEARKDAVKEAAAQATGKTTASSDSTQVAHDAAKAKMDEVVKHHLAAVNKASDAYNAYDDARDATDGEEKNKIRQVMWDTAEEERTLRQEREVAEKEYAAAASALAVSNTNQAMAESAARGSNLSVDRAMTAADEQGVDDTTKVKYRRAFSHIATQMTDEATRLLNMGLQSGFKFYDHVDDVTREADKISGGDSFANRVRTHGFFNPHDGSLNLDGDSASPPESVTMSQNEAMRGVFAHEMTHSLDYGARAKTGKKYSDDAEWRVTHDAEANGLSDYALTSESESFAEFGRLVYGSDVDRETIKAQFPLGYVFFKKRGLINW